MAISIASLALPSKTVQMEFPGYEGFMVNVNYLTKEELLRLRKVCTVKKFSRSSRQVEENMDEDRFSKEYAKATVKGWTGLKIKYLTQLMLVGPEVEDMNPEDEVEYSEENAQALFASSDTFDSWIFSVAGELENFTKNK